MTSPPLLDAALAYAGLGWAVIPLHEPSGSGCSCGPDCRSPGKHPRIITGPRHRNASTDPDRIRRWWRKWPSANVGIITGSRSGLVVIDTDPRNGGERPPELPDTVQCLTGGGGTHDYYAHPGVPIRFKELIFGVDVKGDGGLVVAPPSLHPSGRRYEWEASSDPTEGVEITPLPEWILEVGHKTPSDARRVDTDGPIPDGERNVTLTRIAGAMRRQGADEHAIAAALADINNRRCHPPLPEKEIRKVAWSVARYEPQPGLVDERKQVLIPGHHVRIEDGKPKGFDVREDEFAEDVVSKLPPGAVYRRAHIVGKIIGAPGERAFRASGRDDMVLTVSRYCALISMKVEKEKQGRGRPQKNAPPARLRAYTTWEPTSGTRAGLVLAEAKQSRRIRELRRLTTYPVFCGADLELTDPGWNEESGTLYDASVPVEPLPVDLAVLDDLLCDFPFASPADWQNFIGLLLTVVMRPAIAGNVPFFLIEASIERTGKSKLASELMGTLFLGRPTPVIQLGKDDDEVEKRITSMMLSGDQIVNIDNLNHRVTSPALASLLTADTWSGRVLGRSEIMKVRNELVAVGTGNNVAASGEISKRIVPIRLHPTTAHPELRDDFRHPDLIRHVESVRRQVLGILLGMVRAWQGAGRPPSRRPFGGYEAWAQAVGGVLELHGLGAWLENREEWISGSGSEELEVERFVDEWATAYGTGEVKPSTLVEVAEVAGCFAWATEKKTLRGRAASLTKTVLKALENRPVGKYVVRRRVLHKQPLYRLEILPSAPESKKTEACSGPVVGDLGDLRGVPSSPRVADNYLGINGPTYIAGDKPPETTQPPPHKTRTGETGADTPRVPDDAAGDVVDLWQWARATAATVDRTPGDLVSQVSRVVLGKPGPASADDEAALLGFLNRPCPACNRARYDEAGKICEECKP